MSGDLELALRVRTVVDQAITDLRGVSEGFRTISSTAAQANAAQAGAAQRSADFQALDGIMQKTAQSAAQLSEQELALDRLMAAGAISEQRQAEALQALTVRERELAAQTTMLQDAMTAVAGGFRMALFSLEAFIGYETVKHLTDVNIEFQRMFFTLEAATGSSNKAAQQMEFLERTSESLGIRLQQTGQMYAMLLASAQGKNISVEQIQQLYLGLAKTFDVLHASTHQQQRVMYAFNEMMSQGVIHTRQFQRMLSVDLPGVPWLDIAAKQLGMTDRQFTEAMRKGQLLASDVLPAVARGLNMQYDGTQALDDAVNGLNANLNRMHNAFFLLEITLSKDLVPVLTTFASSLTGIAQAFTVTETKAQDAGQQFIDLRTTLFELAKVGAGVVFVFEEVGHLLGAVVASKAAFAAGGLSALKQVWSGFRDDLTKDMEDLGGRLAKLNETMTDGLTVKPPPMPQLPATPPGTNVSQTQAKQMLDSLQTMADAQRTGSAERLEILLQEVNTAKQYFGEESKEYQNALRKMNAAQKQYDQEQRQLSDLDVERARDSDLSKIAIRREVLSQQRQLGIITNQEELKGEQDLADKEYQIRLHALEQERDLAEQGTTERKRINNEIERLMEQHSLNITQILDKQQLAVRDKWLSIMQPIQQAFSQSIQGIVQGTQTWRQAMGNILQSILAEGVDVAVKGAEQWIASEMAKTAATTTGAATRTAIESTAASTSMLLTAESAIKSILADAWKSAAAVYASIAKIPVVGPFMASAMAFAAGATVAGFVANVASAEGGYDIPPGVDPLTQLHRSEMVLPAELAERVRNMTGGGDTHLHVHAVDARSVARLFANNSAGLVAALRGARRRGEF